MEWFSRYSFIICDAYKAVFINISSWSSCYEYEWWIQLLDLRLVYIKNDDYNNNILASIPTDNNSVYYKHAVQFYCLSL